MFKFRKYIAVFLVFVLSFFYVQMLVPSRKVSAFGIGVPMPITPIMPMSGASADTIKQMSEAMQEPFIDIAYGLTGSVVAKSLITRGYNFDAASQSIAFGNMVNLGKRFLELNIDSLLPSSSLTRIIAGIFSYASQLPSSTSLDSWLEVSLPSIAIDFSKYTVTDFNNITTPYNTMLNGQYPIENNFPFNRGVPSSSVDIFHLVNDYNVSYVSSIHYLTSAYSDRGTYQYAYYLPCVNASTGLPITTIFLNTTNRNAFLYDSAGNVVSTGFIPLSSLPSAYSRGSSHNAFSSAYIGGNIPSNVSVYYGSLSFSYSSSSDLISVAQGIIDGSNLFRVYFAQTVGSFYTSVPLTSVNEVRYGTSWADSIPIYDIDNFGANWNVADKPSIDNLSVDSWLSPFIQIDNIVKDTVQTITDALFIPTDSIDDVTITVDDVGTVSLTGAETVSLSDIISEAITGSIPTSDVVVPLNLFDGVWKFVDYLWSFTKPLVLYTRDLLDTFTLSEGGGLSWIVYGVIVLGFTGGIVSKFLQ